jgi:cytochrome c oxidase subunit 2
MHMESPHRSVRRGRAAHLLLSVVVTTGLAVAAVACGGDASEPSGATSSGDGQEAASPNGLDLDPAAVERGEAGARAMGCAGCHGQDFGGGAGPGWIGLHGSEVVLADGTTVVADEAYLTRAIADPDADLREGYNLRMPANSLTDEAIADIVTYIISLSDA